MMTGFRALWKAFAAFSDLLLTMPMHVYCTFVDRSTVSILKTLPNLDENMDIKILAPSGVVCGRRSRNLDHMPAYACVPAIRHNRCVRYLVSSVVGCVKTQEWCYPIARRLVDRDDPRMAVFVQSTPENLEGSRTKGTYKVKLDGDLGRQIASLSIIVPSSF
jgi:hypothetical protein